MKKSHVTAALVSTALIATPATQVSADAGDFIAGAIIGGIVGATAKKQKRTTQRRTYKSSRPRIPATQEGRQIQSALNYFGFNAGAVDGQLGRKSRTAVSNYQAHLGYPVTGALTTFEKDFLLNSHDRAQAGGQLTLQQIAQNPQGPRGLLITYREQLAGTSTAPVQQFVPVAPVVTAVAPAATTVVAVAPQVAPQPAPAAPLPSLAKAAPSPTALPNFLGNATTVSLASHCNGISLLTNSNGGFTTVSSMTDPMFALNEQFCLARTYAIAQGEEMAGKLAGVTPAQIEDQCAAFGPAMKDQIAAASLKPRDEVIRATSSFILSTGMSPSELAGTAKICLSSGYRTDDLDVAIASGLMLVALGEPVYGELTGHHLSQGFGLSNRPDLAQSWYEMTTNALEAGASGVFAPGQPERATLLKQASMSMVGGGTGIVQPQAASTLPSFSVINK
ncbi:MAG: peptidoglycan-binding domain-containing protein [Paracoccaceae bacterium]